ncbi:MAG: sarcosine oxidase subunit gamma family protein [Pseudomonadota bacterium]
MHDLKPKTALGGIAPQVDCIGALCISEVETLAIASVAARHGKEQACSKVLTRELGTEPPEPGQSVLSEPYSALWMAPAQWLLWAAFDTHEDIEAVLKSQFGSAASVTEQSDGWVCFDISGDSVLDLCERSSSADARGMNTGAAVRTIVHHMGCFLICLDQGRKVRFLGPRSSAASLHHALQKTALAVS